MQYREPIERNDYGLRKDNYEQKRTQLDPKRPERIRIWAEHPLTKRIMVACCISYNPLDAGKGYYMKAVNQIRSAANAMAMYWKLGIRKPRIRVMFE